MAKEDMIKLDGKVVEVLPSTMFRVKVPEVEDLILATISGKMRQNGIKVLLGDTVELEISPYDLNRGRISRRR
jgi:translation initiation factor IF-1